MKRRMRNRNNEPTPGSDSDKPAVKKGRAKSAIDGKAPAKKRVAASKSRGKSGAKSGKPGVKKPAAARKARAKPGVKK